MPIYFGLQLWGFPAAVNAALVDTADPLSFYRRMVGARSPEFTTLWVSDHLQFGDNPQLEGWTRLT